ncbi:MFS transporter [Microbacterium marinilacus]|uniref:MFS transporter n=1 Tax=Microbacterium marinilacus TaxID=415209 RepID=A0ABP7B5L6_9MICO|nr:MFS transporter [Microbacterium marinilacus]MBY0689924.1 MFS transporter [Microbacterium marinilacus]
MSSYRELARTPGVARIIAAQLTARFPSGMISLGLLIHVEHLTHSYAAAGVVLAAVSIGQAVAGPVTSRWMGRWGMRRVLTILTAIYAAAIATIAVAPLPVPALVALGLVAGLATPPVQSAVRTIYPKLVNARQLTALYSLDASLQEMIWVLAPVLITFLALQVSTVLGLLAVVVIAIGGGAWFILSPETGRVRIPPSRSALGRVLRKPTVLLATAIGLLFIGAAAAIEAGIVATFGEGGVESGLVLAVFALGSLVGGLGSGSIPMSPWSTARRLGIVAVGTALTLLWVDNPWWLGGALFVAGVGFAPALAVMLSSTSASVKFSETAEAYGWINTGQLLGAALGSMAAGFAIDGIGSIGAYVVSLTMIVGAALVAAVFHRGFPDLRHRDASPIPDTEPVQTIT